MRAPMARDIAQLAGEAHKLEKLPRRGAGPPSLCFATMSAEIADKKRFLGSRLETSSSLLDGQFNGMSLDDLDPFRYSSYLDG